MQGPWQETPPVSDVGKAKVTAHVQNCWEKLFPGSILSHTGRHWDPRWGEACDREMIPPHHLPRDTWISGDWAKTRWHELRRAAEAWWSSAWEQLMESEAADFLIFRADLPIAKPSKQEVHS